MSNVKSSVNFFKIALRALLLNKVRSFLTMLGVIIGVAAVIILTAIVGGLQTTITSQFEKFGSNSLYVFPGVPGQARGPGGSVVNKLQFNFASKIRNVNGVAEVSAMVFTSGDAKYKDKESKSAQINGVEANILNITGNKIELGRFFTKSEESGGKMVAVLGPTVKKNLFGDQNPIGQEIKVKGKTFTVIGISEKQGATLGQDQDNDITIPLSVARQRFQIDKPNFFFIKVESPEKVKTIQRDIERSLTQLIDKEDFSVISTEQSVQFISNILGVLATALGGIAAISLLVGGVGIMNIMFVSVTERTREIGLRKAVGANSKNILTQFLMEAIILSLLGGFLGILAGMGVSAIIGKFIDITINFMYVFLSFGVSAVIGIIFGVAPAIKASKMDPIVALRYE